MKNKTMFWFSFLMILLFVPTANGQDNTQPAKSAPESAEATAADTREKNLQEYIELLRRNVRQDKAEIMGTVMLLSADDAAKFWPIYSEYNAELTKVNDQRVANVEDYVSNYNQLTDQKADELVQKAINFRKARNELLAKYYERVKQSLGAVTAARFLQVEDQMLLIIDLQIASSLPLASESS